MQIIKSAYSTESDVEQKFLYPLLFDLLHYNPEEIKTKEYLAPTEIDMHSPNEKRFIVRRTVRTPAG